MTSFRYGQSVKLYNLHSAFAHLDGMEGVVVNVTYRGPSVCALYDVRLPDGQEWGTCDCHLKPTKAPALDWLGRSPIGWHEMPWRPDPRRLPEIISAELNRRRKARRQG